jgi:glycerophosphoryl diester phosphodiesterase
MLVLGHRGARGNVIENTMAAFEYAIAVGVDGIEIDVRRSADGQAILFHDRLVGDTDVSSLGHHELIRIVGHEVPTLGDVLAKHPTDLLWNVELKTVAALEAAAPILQQFRESRRLLITSFRHDVVLECAGRLGIPCGILVAHRPCDPAVLLRSVPNHSLVRTVVWDYEAMEEAIDADEGLLRQAAEVGLKSFAYGVQTVADLIRCRRLGIEAIITDNPAQLLQEAHGGTPHRTK